MPEPSTSPLVPSPVEAFEADRDRTLAVLARVNAFREEITDLRALLDRILVESASLLHAEASSVMLYDEVTDELHFEVIKGEGSEALRDLRLSVSKAQGIAGQCARERQVINVGDAQADNRHFGKADQMASLVAHQLLAVPMVHQGELIGVLEVLNRTDGSVFDRGDELVCQIVAGQAAQAIANARLIAQGIEAERRAALGTAISGMAHYIKNILAVMQGSTHLIDMGLVDCNRELIEKAWPVLKSNTEKISELVQEMLAYSKSRKPNLQPASGADLLAECHGMAKDRAAQRGVELALEMPEGDPLPLECDPTRITDGLLNLVTNALDAVDEKSGRVALRATRDARRVGLIISVIDNGGGIPEHVREKIFQPFFSTKGEKGTGLGLAMTRKILEEHGGSLTLESTGEAGTVFTVRLPLAPDATSPEGGG